jgi:hypothetical protein
MLALLIAQAHAGTEIGTSRKFGLGIQLGAPTGLTGKFYLADHHAIDFVVGDAYYGYGPYWDGIYAHVTYQYQLETLAHGDGVTIPFRIGIGGFVSGGYYRYVGAADAVVGARVPFGLDFDLESAPVQLYIEAAIDLIVVPPIGVGVDGGIGARYYF